MKKVLKTSANLSPSFSLLGKIPAQKKTGSSVGSTYLTVGKRCILPGLKTWLPLELGLYISQVPNKNLSKRGRDPFLIFNFETWVVAIFSVWADIYGPNLCPSKCRNFLNGERGDLISSLKLSHSPRFIPFMQIENSKVQWNLHRWDFLAMRQGKRKFPWGICNMFDNCLVSFLGGFYVSSIWQFCLECFDFLGWLNFWEILKAW